MKVTGEQEEERSMIHLMWRPGSSVCSALIKRSLRSCSVAVI